MPKQQSTNRIPAISSIRFILAVWVAVSHYGLPIFSGHPHGSALGLFRGAVNSAFNGPAAVIVFFVISGFCIHFPNSIRLSVHSWKDYYARRYVRILIPMAAAIALSMTLGMQFSLFNKSILWSLLCEEIYYFLYPLLLAAQHRMGWRTLIEVSGVLAFLTVLTDPHAGDFPSYGPFLNWILGLPCWLLGCRMAERLPTFSRLPVSFGRLWLWRGGVWALSFIVLILRFHTPVGYPWTLDLFGVFAMLWLEREIRYYYYANPNPHLENLGEASYSIYLTHTHGSALASALAASLSLSATSIWACSVLLCTMFTTIFYWGVERPSHQLARKLSKRRQKARVASAAADSADIAGV